MLQLLRAPSNREAVVLSSRTASSHSKFRRLAQRINPVRVRQDLQNILSLSSGRAWLVLLVLCGGLSGCGGDQGDRPDLGQVTGTVTLDGKPLPGVIINFKPEVGRTATATTDDSGRYELEYRYRVSGAPIGKSTVSFAWPMGTAGTWSIPEKYGSQSTLKKEVQQGNNTFDFALESK